ncbi:MAG: O-antigen ligase family protein [Saprospiraceae bacterium]|nr:O-antigen ligase family protein [Bacteroidia bacterium]NNE15181.1 O-antigen ligase family protein [Saprospiraceae bacterium]NNL91681.1 O-antigen ligase family protein [Saprospiraceae bacterium]
MIFFLIAGLWKGNFKSNFKGFIKNRYYLAVTGIFLIYFISGLWSENIDYFLNRSRIKLPIFFLPFAFYATPKLDKKVMTSIMWGFIGIITFSILWSIGMFLTDIEYYTNIYGKGQIIPTPIHHIRYSIMISIAFCMLVAIIWDKIKEEQKWPRLYIILAIFLVIYLHLLAVRSGLMTLYVVFLFMFIFYIKEKGNKLLAVGSAASFVLLIFLSTQFVPTIKNKISYMKYSLELFSKNENIRELSDSRRLGSIFAGLQLTKDNPALGVGIGDIMDETDSYLSEHYPELTNLELLPHNQYILSSAALGIIGLILFTIFSCMPLFYLNGMHDFFLTTTQFIFFASFMVEHTIESQIGVALYIFITLFAMKYRQTKLEGNHV